VIKGNWRKGKFKELWHRERQYRALPTPNSSCHGLGSDRRSRKRSIQSAQQQCSSRMTDNQYRDFPVNQSESHYHKDAWDGRDRDRRLGTGTRKHHKHKDRHRSHNFLPKHQENGKRIRLSGHHGKKCKGRGKNRFSLKCSPTDHERVFLSPGSEELWIEHKRRKVHQDNTEEFIEDFEERLHNRNNSRSDFSNISSPFSERQVGC